MPNGIRLAFLVVYLAKEPYRPVFERHLEYIERYAPPGEWWIDAVAHRASEEVRDRLRSKPYVRLHGPDSIPPVQQGGSLEHAAYLDALVARALDAGATHICTLDDDSFPVRADWCAVALDHLAAGHAFVAPLRVENGDTDLPHPSFLFSSADFIRAEQPGFFPDRTSPAFRRYRRDHQQVLDTGSGFAVAAHRSGRSWAPLLRSNARDDHPIMAGIYGDIAFHFGGANRAKVFRFDLQGAQGKDEMMARHAVAREKNEPIFRAGLARLQNDMDGYLAYLRGEGSTAG